MTLRRGVRIGPYEIESLVGDNGLGDVWKARHSVTGSAIALRILPAAPPHDPDRFARFDRDIRVLGSLNHPNIATVDGIVDTDDTRALAVAWVDGPSLVERLRGGPLPIDETVLIAAQVADAVGAAHDRAVVHGNLQPCNIKIGSDRSVRVLDLGLNTLFAAEIPHLGTRPSPLARAVSVVIGTGSYMSPEQIRGVSADARADVWAFGCVLFEMLTGRPAFGGTDVTETFALVLHAEPEWTRVPPSTPPALVLLLKTCLNKDAKARREDLSGVSIELREILQEQGVQEAVLRESILEHHIPWLKRWVKGRVPRSFELDEDDLVQEAMLDATRRIQDFRSGSEGALRAYLRVAVKNRIRDEARRLRRLGLRDETDEDTDEERDVYESQVGPDVEKRYEAALEELSERERQLIRARLEQGLSYEQIRVLLELSSADAARIGFMRAIKRLVDRMKNLFRK
jgi:RNA polymerase sigma factor (sigma-70 family)